jgi:hypothetical protein
MSRCLALSVVHQSSQSPHRGRSVLLSREPHAGSGPVRTAQALVDRPLLAAHNPCVRPMAPRRSFVVKRFS